MPAVIRWNSIMLASDIIRDKGILCNKTEKGKQ